jgi:hypothetical protein
MRHAIRFACLASALTTTTAALSQDFTGPELSWEAPAGCPQLSEVRARIDAIAGSTVKRETRLQAQGSISKEDGRFHLKLVVRDGELTGERNITSDSCEDLAGATAVALGLMLRSAAPLSESTLRGADAPNTAGNGSPEQPKSSAPPAKGPEASDVPEPDTTPDAPSRAHWQAIVRAPVLVADFGPLPQPSFGVALGVGGRYDEWRFLLEGQLWLSQTVRGGADLAAYSARVGRQTAAFTVGRGLRFGRVELAPCLTLALERLSGRGAGAGVTASDARAVWLSTGAGLQGSLELWRALAVFVDVGARIQTSRPRIAIDGLGDVRQLGPVALNSALGLEWTF